MIASSRPHLSFEQYCEIEADSPIRHEYQDGQAWLMAGSSREHAATAGNVVGLLTAALGNREAAVHASDWRVRVPATGLTTYPDACVVCGRAELDPEDRLGHTVINPVVVVEVLSPTTEKYDRTEKLAHYQLIDSVREVVLVGHEAPRVDVWRRGDDERWTEASYCDGAVELLSLGVSLPITDMYRDLPARAE